LSADFEQSEKLLADVVINDMAQDASGKIWLATYGQGVWCLPSFGSRFIAAQGLLNPSIVYSNSMQSVLVTSINKGIFSIQHGHVQWANQRLPAFFKGKGKSNIGTTFLFTQSDSDEIIVCSSFGMIRQRHHQADTIHTNKPISAFWKDTRGSYWAGMRTGLLQIASDFKQTQEVSFFRDKIIRSLAEMKPGRLLVGTNDGL
jgi:ligand-binding sensor domain-containing protein